MPPINPFAAQDIQKALAGRYLLGQELRTGGQGVVYRATRICNQSGVACSDEVALKLHLDDKQNVRVEREIEAMTGLRHPCLATLLEDGTVAIAGRSVRYIAWGFIDGEALDTKISSGGPLDERAVIIIGRDISRGIAALWSKRIVHRDIAPKNIMVRTDGTAILIDLGGARHLDTSSVTAIGATFGTHGYFSPEQARAERSLTCSSDIFTLAVVLLECLLGHHPTNGDQHGLVNSQLRAKNICPNISDQLGTIVDQMLKFRAPFRPTPEKLSSAFEVLLT